MDRGSLPYHGDLKCARKQKTKCNFGDCSGVLEPGHLGCPLSYMPVHLLMCLSVLTWYKPKYLTDWLSITWIPILKGSAGKPQQKIINLVSGYTPTHCYGTDESVRP